MMYSDTTNIALSIKRVLNRRDAFHRLLYTRGHGLFDCDVCKLSHYELIALLSALNDEIGISSDLASKEDATPTFLTGRKRLRSEIGNNYHAILLFVERVLHERFPLNSQSNVSYIDREKKAYIGLHDALFRAEEKILCLAFTISFHTIHTYQKQHQKCAISFEAKNISDSISNTPVINTALHLIDFIVAVSKRERLARNETSETKMKNGTTHFPSSKYQRYHHLLLSEQTRRDLAEKKRNDILTHTSSVIEINYPDQLIWLTSFREKYTKVAITKNSNEPSFCDVQSSENELFSKELETSKNIEPSQLGSDNISIDTPKHTTKSLLLDGKINEEASDNSGTAVEKDDVKKVISKDNETHSLPEPSPAITSLDELDRKAHDLRISLINMSSSDLSQGVVHITESIINLLKGYGDLDGTSGIERCGSIINGTRLYQHTKSNLSNTVDFYLSDVLVSSVVKEFLTNATGALRTNAFLRSFVLPLVLEMNPITTEDARLSQGKPASRLMTSLLASLARDRPMECVVSILIPALVLDQRASPTEPNRFQCELIAKVFRGKDALSTPAIALFLEKILPSKNSPSLGSMPWTENSLPLVSTCLNRHLPLTDGIVAGLADRVEHLLSPGALSSMEKSMKFSTVFHMLVTKYGRQLKAMGKVDILKSAVSRLKTFMSKAIKAALEKL